MDLLGSATEAKAVAKSTKFDWRKMTTFRVSLINGWGKDYFSGTFAMTHGSIKIEKDVEAPTFIECYEKLLAEANKNYELLESVNR